MFVFGLDVELDVGFELGFDVVLGLELDVLVDVEVLVEEVTLEVVSPSLVVNDVDVLSLAELLDSLFVDVGLWQPEITKPERSAKNNNCFFIMTYLLFENDSLEYNNTKNIC